MRLDDQRESDYVEDRRSQGGFSGGGRGISMGTLMMLWPILRPLLRTKFGWMLIAGGAALYMMGINPLAFFSGGNVATPKVDKKVEDKQARFISKVLASTEDVWTALLPKYGLRYKKPKVVLFRGFTRSGCGAASAQTGPFYCPADQKIYLDLSFFDELARRFGATGDFAQAYVLAHEVGHHVQNLTGILDKAHRLQARMSKRESNALQVRLELQADCYAGIWGHYADKQRLLEPGDVEEAMRAAAAIGDDTIQRKTQGYVRPDAFTHGSAKQRAEWFMRGFKTGDMRACDTFQGMR